MSVCVQRPSLYPALSYILGHNIDIEGGVGQTKLSGSGKGEGLADYPRLPRSCIAGKVIEEGHKTIESKTS